MSVLFTIVLAVLTVSPAASSETIAVDPFRIDWWSIDNGATTLVGSDFVLRGTVGQSDGGAPVSTSARFELVGGFWSTRGSLMFVSDFEEGTLGEWTKTMP